MKKLVTAPATKEEYGIILDEVWRSPDVASIDIDELRAIGVDDPCKTFVGFKIDLAYASSGSRRG